MLSIKNDNYQAFRYLYYVIEKMTPGEINQTLIVKNNNNAPP